MAVTAAAKEEGLVVVGFRNQISKSFSGPSNPQRVRFSGGGCGDWSEDEYM